MSERNLVAIVAERAGGMPEDEAQAVVAAVAPAIAAACSERVARRIASTLGGATRFERIPARGVEDVHRIVAARLGSSLVRAAELTRIVGEAIGERLDGEDWALARRDLPADVAAVLEPRGSRESRASSSHDLPHASERTLAAGAPGAQRSIASTHHPIAQPASVDDDAQHEERLATAHGTRQEERDETLATGRPGSSRPLSTGK